MVAILSADVDRHGMGISMGRHMTLGAKYVDDRWVHKITP